MRFLPKLVKSSGSVHLEFFDSSLMTSSLEFPIQLDIDYFEGIFNGYHSTPERNHMGIVVFFGQSSTILVPAQPTSYTSHLVGHHGFLVATATENDAQMSQINVGE